MNQITDQIDAMESSPENWVEVMEGVVDAMMESGETSQHSMSGFTEEVLEKLTRTIQDSPQITTPESRVQAHRQSLNLIQMPALLLDESGIIIEQNDLLEHFFYQNSVISIDNDQLRFQTDDQQTHFQDLINQTQTKPGVKQNIFQSGTGESITISIFHSSYSDRQLYTVLFCRNLLESPIALDMIMVTFSLSKQQALLSLQLASGNILKVAAHTLGVSYETARGYLKSIFSKTNCKNQLMLAFKVHHACMPRLPDALPANSFTDRSTPELEIMMASFSLSRQEALLALELFSGKALKQAAHHIGVSYESARGYLKSIYSKTACNSQISLALKIHHETLPISQAAEQERENSCIDEIFSLKNGRTLSYCIYGPADGSPLIAHHTICGSRNQFHHNNQIFYRHHVKVIVVDRPGYGSSSYDKERKLHDWPRDLEELLEHLGVTGFALLGIQFGAEYALACSQYFGERISSTQLISMECPPELLSSIKRTGYLTTEKFFQLSKRNNFAAKFMKNRVAAKAFQQIIKFLTNKYTNKPQELFQQIVAFKSEKDQQLLGRDTFVQEAFDTWQVAYAQTEGLMMVKDLQIILSLWQIDFKAIKQPVHIWHSRHDPQALFSSVEHMLPHFEEDIVTLHVIEDDSVMTFYHHMEEIIEQVAKSKNKFSSKNSHEG